MEMLDERDPSELYGKYAKLADPKSSGNRSLLGSLFGGTQSNDDTMPSMNFERAFLVILLGAAKADGDIRREEEDQIRLVTSRSRTFARLTNSEIADHQLQTTKWMFKFGINEIVGKACDVVRSIDDDPKQRQEWKRSETVLTLAADLAFVDRSFEEVEKQYLYALAKRLGVDDKRRDDVIRLVEIKNAY